MHQIIRIIVYAQNKDEALSKAKERFEEMCGEANYPFDYFTTFDDNTSTVSGKARWGKRPVVSLTTSKEGKKLIDDGMKCTKDKFIDNIKKIRDTLKKYSDDELFDREVKDTKKKVVQKLEGEDNDYSLGDFQHRCYSLGEYQGSNIYVYDSDGEGIRDGKHLKNVLDKWKCLYEDAGKKNPNKDMNCYIIPADVHY